MAPGVRSASRPMGKWTQVLVGESLGDVSGRRFERAVLRDCTITKVNGARFINCDLYHSALEVDEIYHMLGVTITLDCFSFEGLRLSEVALNSILFLLTTTLGNDSKRQRILGLLSEDEVYRFRRLFECLSRRV